MTDYQRARIEAGARAHVEHVYRHIKDKPGYFPGLGKYYAHEIYKFVKELQS